MAVKVQFGTTWWGKAWLNALTKLDHANRLGRGRTYYRNGRVDSLTFSRDTMTVKAVVAGSAYAPYEVTIGLTPLPEEQIKQLVNAIAQRPRLLAALLKNELSPEVGELAESMGIALFPTSWREFTMHCTCPDVAVPCKHLAAVYYAIVKNIDIDPMWTFYFRGVDLVERLKNCGVDLEQAVVAEDPSWADWMAAAVRCDGPVPAMDELPLYLLTPMGRQLTGLMDFSSCGTVMTRAWMNKRYADADRVVEKLREQQDHALTRFETLERRIAGKDGVKPRLVDIEGRPRFILAGTPARTRYNDDDEQTSLAALAIVNADEAQDHSLALYVWYQLKTIAWELMQTGAVVPQLVKERRSEGYVGTVVWTPAVQSGTVAQIVAGVQAFLAGHDLDGLTNVGFGEEAEGTAPGVAFVALSVLITGFLRHGMQLSATQLKRPEVLAFTGEASVPAYGLHDEVIQRLRRILTPVSVARRLEDWVPVMTVRTGTKGRISVNLGVVSRDSAPSTRPTLYRDVLKQKAFDEKRYAIISVFESLCRVCPLLRPILSENGKPASLLVEELQHFLFDSVPALELMGVRVMLPRRLKRMLEPKLLGKLSNKGASKSLLTQDALADFEWTIAIGDHALTREEFDELLEQAGSVVSWKEEFIYLDPKVLARMKATLDQSQELSYLDQVKMALSGEQNGFPVTVTQDIVKRIDRLNHEKAVPLPKKLCATLRPYQVRGYRWLRKNLDLGLGALIADDMGLGKTLQVIAVLAWLKEAGELKDEKVLCVVPTTLLTNWVREIAKFAPDLTVSVYHGAQRRLPMMSRRADVVLTSYGTMRRDVELLKKEPWRLMVLDEAQAIKNVGTAVSRAARELNIKQVVGMSGTPVENRLMEYWSLLSIVQPGLLGTSEDFFTRFVRPIEAQHDPRALELFRKMTAPFMLRRLKTDKKIISDLPDKLVCDRFSALTPRQAVLYQSVLAQKLRRVAQAADAGEKASRNARVLELMTALKQICNSPSQYEKTVSAIPDSGKGEMLLDILGQCRDEHRKTIVFTQYREMGERLQGWIENAFGRRPAFLHGGVSIKERSRMVDAFQNDPRERVMIISLKAGGTGLNLTAASVVVHYDLWWNPAVENQATDRAFRIGQTRDVLVYRLLTPGTFEEKINDMLNRKRALADATVAGGEAWIGQLSNEELAEIFKLN